MPARRAAIVIVLTLLALAPPLALSSVGAVRLAGVGLLWWYAVLAAPVAAALVAAVALLMSPSRPE